MLNVDMMAVNELRPYPANPRANDCAVEAVARSIQEFGWRVPIVVDTNHVIIAGHTRYKAAVRLGLREVPVHVAVGLSPEQARAYRIADNQTATIADWDEDKLIAELMALQDAGVDLDATGFTEAELNDLLAAEVPDPQADPDDVPEAPRVAETHPGDLWLLGGHRLLCGDATNPAAWERLLDGHLANLLLTDPPYGVNYAGKTKDALTIANDAIDDDEAYRAFLAQAIGQASVRLKPGGGFYVWHADSRGLVVRQACVAAGLTIRQCLVWAKNAMVLGRQDYQWKHEPCLYGWREGAAHVWLGERTQTTVLEFDRPSRSESHPTMKPVELFRQLVRNSCPKQGIVLDPFVGSGTTIVAAHLEGRKAYAMELDPVYVDVAVRRWEQVAGRTAERIPAPDSASTAVEAMP